MIRKMCLILTVIFTASLSIVSAQQTGKVTPSGIGYLEYLPQGYHSNSHKYPLVISLHGIKEKGTSSTDPKRVLADLAKVDNVGLPKYVRAGEKFPFILISPQLKSTRGLWPPEYVVQVINHVKKYLRVDERRIYLTGLSLGGFGVWRTAGEYPGLFAAIAPICSGGNALRKADEIAAHDLPIWGFHGNRDKVVSYNVTLKMINAINSSPQRPNPLAKATIFQGMGHAIWDRAYHDTNLLEWMLSQRKGSAPSGGSDGDLSGNDSPDEGSSDKESANKPPVVKAGGNRTLTLPANSIYIGGSAEDPDGRITTYKWTKVAGGRASLSGTNGDRLRAYNLRQGTYVFRLTARDNDGAVKSDNIRVVVRKKSTEKSNSGGKDNSKNETNDHDKGNARPVANAGPDIKIRKSTGSIQLVGSGRDSDGRIVSWRWKKLAGPGGVTMKNLQSSHATLTNLKEGRYYFSLTVRDDSNAVDVDKMLVRVSR